jgi:hypothetical protein
MEKKRDLKECQDSTQDVRKHEVNRQAVNCREVSRRRRINLKSACLTLNLTKNGDGYLLSLIIEEEQWRKTMSL